MVDDKPNARDRNRVPGDQDHEVAQFALHHGISLGSDTEPHRQVREQQTSSRTRSVEACTPLRTGAHPFRAC